MKYKLKGGLNLDVPGTNSSSKFIFLNGGTILDSSENTIKVYMKTKILKKAGVNNIQINDKGEIINVDVLNVDFLTLLMVSLDINGDLLTSVDFPAELDSPIPVTSFNNVIEDKLVETSEDIDKKMEDVTLAIDNKVNVVSETIDDKLSEISTTLNDKLLLLESAIADSLAKALALDTFEDTIRNEYTEVSTVIGDKANISRIPKEILSIYVENKGELSVSSINRIEGSDIFFDDNELSGDTLHIEYSILENI